MKQYIVCLYFLFFIFYFSCDSPTPQKVIDGRSIFRSYCVTCHGVDGSMMTNGAKDLRLSTLSMEERITIISNGKNVMTAFKNTLTPSQIERVAKYTLELKVN